MRQKQVKNKVIRTLLDLLDESIEGFYQRTRNYPVKIIMNKTIKDKLFSELELEPKLDNSWRDTRDNYRGIKIEIHNIEQIKIE